MKYILERYETIGTFGRNGPVDEKLVCLLLSAKNLLL